MQVLVSDVGLLKISNMYQIRIDFKKSIAISFVLARENMLIVSLWLFLFIIVSFVEPQQVVLINVA